MTMHSPYSLCYVNIFYARTNVSPLMLACVPFNGDKSTTDISEKPLFKYSLFVDLANDKLLPNGNCTFVPSVFLFVLTFKADLPS